MWDFNSKNTLWGSETNDKQSHINEEILDNYNLNCLNDGSSPTFLSDIYSSWSPIVLTLISDNVAPLCDWDVLNKFNRDHLPVLTKYNVNNQWKNKDLCIPKWKFNKTNWANFKADCNNLNINKITNNNIDIFNDNLTNSIIEIAKKNNKKQHIPKTNKPSTIIMFLGNQLKILLILKTLNTNYL